MDIEQDQDVGLARPAVDLESQRATLTGPIRIAHLGAVPAYPAHKLLPAHGEVFFTERDEQARETQQAGVLVGQRPIDPRELIILAIRVIVSQLRAAEFVPLP